MFDTEFWGEIISTYTDADALEDGTFTDVSGLGVEFNGLPINRATIGAAVAAQLKSPSAREILQLISGGCTLDGEGIDAWGIFEPHEHLGNEKFWLIPNEVNGCTLMLPSEY